MRNRNGGVWLKIGGIVVLLVGNLGETILSVRCFSSLFATAIIPTICL